MDFRKWQDLSAYKKIALSGVTVLLLWLLGFTDKMREESFENFNWPNLKEQQVPATRFTQFPSCRFTDDEKKLMILIKSSAKNEAMRESVRKTWGVYRKERQVEVMPIFVVGRVENSELQRRVEKESEQKKDILAISAIDSYRNNTFKLFAAIDYAENPMKCESPDYILLVDDDYIVHITNLVSFAKTKNENDLVYEGFVFDTSPFRMKIHKHSISLAEYPYSRYPPYVSAGAVFLTSGTVKRFKSFMRSLKMFPFDDVFTGILAKMVGIPATHNDNFVFWSRRVSQKEWNDGIIAVHGYARKDLEYEYNQLFG
ncbi:hypothetical protein CAEBREN_26282 [Caenorhabditis brenneri]|uniref:Hexosyltransferase n=1 Tax=Caenorhabditis brenneri TaxID=135651 RepID=G0PAF7_CAEBE|nr:hypothetical protein CAEBREN_26282 [Caenorhabditis brenneri]